MAEVLVSPSASVGLTDHPQVDKLGSVNFPAGLTKIERRTRLRQSEKPRTLKAGGIWAWGRGLGLVGGRRCASLGIFLRGSFDINEHGLVNGFPALFYFILGLLNLHPVTMNENDLNSMILPMSFGFRVSVASRSGFCGGGR